jgi:microcystin-dependent protein
MKDKAQVELTFRLPIDLCCKSDEPSTGGGSGIEEAPKDGKSYVRRDGNWVTIENGNLGSIDIPSVVSNSYVGEIFYYAKTTPPPNALYCDGGEVSRGEYAELFAVIGTSFGEGDGSATFNLPDMRGEFVRGYDPTNVRDPQGSTREFGKHQEATEVPLFSIFRTSNTATSTFFPNPDTDGKMISFDNYDGTVTQKSTAAKGLQLSNNNGHIIEKISHKTRPTNINLLPCIRCR